MESDAGLTIAYIYGNLTGYLITGLILFYGWKWLYLARSRERGIGGKLLYIIEILLYGVFYMGAISSRLYLPVVVVTILFFTKGNQYSRLKSGNIKMKWTTRTNKKTHRTIQGVILLIGLLGINLFIYFPPVGFKRGGFLSVVLGMYGFLIFLVWAFRIRKFTWEEKFFKKKILELFRLKEREFLSEEECKKRKVMRFNRFLIVFAANSRRDFEYKINRLKALKEEEFISEEDFKKGKTVLFEKFLSALADRRAGSFVHRVKRLGILKEEGFISEEEFKKGKEKLFEKSK